MFGLGCEQDCKRVEFLPNRVESLTKFMKLELELEFDELKMSNSSLSLKNKKFIINLFYKIKNNNYFIFKNK